MLMSFWVANWGEDVCIWVYNIEGWLYTFNGSALLQLYHTVVVDKNKAHNSVN